MADEITTEKIDAKLAKGEALTAEETKFVMSMPPENASVGNKYVQTEDEEKIDWNQAEDFTTKKKEEKEEESEKKEPKKETPRSESKKEEPPKEEKKEESEDPFIKIERELAKPEGQEDLNEFTPREKAYFHQMRRDRKSRQKAEEERDQLRFRQIQRETKEEEKKKEEAKVDPLAELKKRDQEDFLTVKDVVDLMEKATLKETAKVDEKKAGPDPLRARYLKMCQDEARSAHPEDYDAVMELAEEIIGENEKYIQEIGKAVAEGNNPAIKAYEIIKHDPEFSNLLPAAEAKVKARQSLEKKPETKTPEALQKEKEAKAAEEAMEKNKDKTKTTGHAEGEKGGATEGDTIDGYTIIDIMKMSDLQFAKLPRKTRQEFLKRYGA